MPYRETGQWTASSVLAVPCKHCGATLGQQCHTNEGYETQPHGRRLVARDIRAKTMRKKGRT